MILQSDEQLKARAERIDSSIAESQALIVGKTIVSAVAEYGTSGAKDPLQCSDRGDWVLTFSDGSRVRVTASYDDSGVDFQTE